MLEELGASGRRIALGIGVFDGVHLGHRRLLDELAVMAGRTGAHAAALTFDPHPRAVLCPHDPPRLLVAPETRVRLLKQYGAETVGVVRFDAAFAGLSPAEFLEKLLDLPARVTGICVGSRWRFGAGASGDTPFLAAWCAARGIECRAVPELSIDGATVSSSAIRRAVAAGRIAGAERMLGRPYRLEGTVEAGYHVAGSTLHRPTANLRVDVGILPPDGVYAVRAFLGEARYPAAVNLGFAPTFGWPEGERRLEVHLLDYHGNLYGSRVGVEFLRYLRPERTFADAEALRRQIEQDIGRIRAEFGQPQRQDDKRS